jgi:hypothetical protein
VFIKYITDCAIQLPDGLDQKEGGKAVRGRIMRIKVSRPGVSFTWQFTGCVDVSEVPLDGAKTVRWYNYIGLL